MSLNKNVLEARCGHAEVKESIFILCLLVQFVERFGGLRQSSLGVQVDRRDLIWLGRLHVPPYLKGEHADRYVQWAKKLLFRYLQSVYGVHDDRYAIGIFFSNPSGQISSLLERKMFLDGTLNIGRLSGPRAP